MFGNIPALQAAIEPAKFAEKVFEFMDMNPDEILNLEALEQFANPAAQQPGLNGGVGADLTPEQLTQQVQQQEAR